MGPLPIDLLDIHAICDGPLEPSLVQKGKGVLFTVSDCDLPPNFKVGMKFQKEELSREATYDATTRVVSTTDSLDVSFTGPSAVYITLDKVPLSGEKFLFVYTHKDSNYTLEVDSVVGSNVSVSFHNCPKNITDLSVKCKF